MKRIKYDVKVNYNHFTFYDCNEALQYAIFSRIHDDDDTDDVEIALITEDTEDGEKAAEEAESEEE